MSTRVPPPDDTPPPAATESAPQWAADLQRALAELPGKLKASISDDDKSGIAEAVHGLFERSGAFESAEVKQAEQETEQETEATTTGDNPETAPAKASGMSRFAAWFSGE